MEFTRIVLSDALFREALGECAEALTRSFASSTRAQPEDQLKRPLQNLLEALLPGVVTRTEATVADLGGRPDIAVDVERLLTGHVELKAPGLGATPSRFRDAHSRAQWKKFKALPNLIYTDGNEWTLFRSGERAAGVRFSGDVTADGAEAFTAAEAEELRRLLHDFLQWEPSVPTTSRALAELLAPLCRMIRDDVRAALDNLDSGLSHLAREWRDVLFPDADDAQFADAYAQTLTYALLLARFSGAERADLATAERTLDSGHGLLAGALRILASPDVRSEVGAGLDVLIRAVGAVDADRLQGEGNDPWLYFYEHFLAAYDPRLRNNYGVYYTPPAVIGAQVRLVAELLEERFEKDLAFAADDVVVLDPATGTGAYPLAVMQHALDRAAHFYGDGVRGQYATQLARNVHAFELLVGPYSVAHLRMTQKVLEEGGSLPEDGAHVYLADTLESPNARDLESHGFVYRRLTEEHRRARHVKKDQRVLVCLGNPPYDRQQRDEKDRERGVELLGGWVRFGEQNLNNETNGILKDFVEPVLEAGQGGHLKNLYNLYVYFWRWALWKVFENVQDAGIVTFITAASYLRGPGFIGMREHMRRTFDELWIIDLEGDNLGARRTENVFAIQNPVAIALGVRYGAPQPDEPAAVRYTRIEGTREEKLAHLDGVTRLNDLDWRDCPSDWHGPFLPLGTGDYYSWPLLTDVYPWQQSGMKIGRTWTVAADKATLEARWARLVHSSSEERVRLFVNRATGRKASDRVQTTLAGGGTTPVLDLVPGAPLPRVSEYSYRTLDVQYVIADARFIDRPGPSLWRVLGDRQVFLTSLLTGVLGLGPAATVAAHPPDLHHYRGSFGGKDVIPLWRDAEATSPNVASGVLAVLEEALGEAVAAEDLFAYTYAVLASPGYVDRFSEELTVPGPRLPIPRDTAAFKAMAGLGRTLIGWHTYGERFGNAAPQGTARNLRAVPAQAESYPEGFRYDAETSTLHVGEGSFAPVAPEIWNYSVSGFRVVESWLGYRMRDAAGRSSSPLDEIRPNVWTVDMTRTLLELLWTLEATLAVWPTLEKHLDLIVAAPTFTAAEFPQPTDDERSPPSLGDARQERLL